MKSKDDLFEQNSNLKKKKNGSNYTIFNRISFRFVSFVIIIIFLTGGIISFASIRISKDAIRHEILNNNLTQANLVAEFTSNYIEVIQANVVSFASRPSLEKYLNEKNMNEITVMLQQFIGMQVVLDTCGVYSTEGIQLALSNPTATTIGQSFADREWFQQAITTSKPFQSAPIKSRATGKAIAVYAVPLLDVEGHIRGVFVGSISLEKLSTVIEKLNKDNDAVYSIIDLRNGGSTLAHNNPELIMTSLSDEKEINIAALLAKGESGVIELTSNSGETDLYGFATISNLPWGVMITTPSRIAYASISSLMQTAGIISVMIVFIVAGLSVLFVLQITKPLLRLIEETKKIGMGNLDYQFKTTEKNEIGDLSRAFGDMTENLKKAMVSNETLEQKVKERTSQLEQTNQELESFSYSVSHDLRAPLRHIHGFVELLNNHLIEKADEKTQHYIKVISKASNDMGQLIDDLLSFSRMGKAQIDNISVDLNTIIKDEIKVYQLVLKDRNINWNISKLPYVMGDVNMIRLVFANLISNALKFTNLKATAIIEIGYEPDMENKDYIIIYIKDNGVGFDMQYKDKLFGVFQRLHSQKDYEGTGIGLANVKRIIQRHGGRVWADSIIEKGSVFYFTLPKYKEEEKLWS